MIPFSCATFLDQLDFPLTIINTPGYGKVISMIVSQWLFRNSAQYEFPVLNTYNNFSRYCFHFLKNLGFHII